MIFAVAPFAGAWIEMADLSGTEEGRRSLPSRERGLKSKADLDTKEQELVAPFAGAWIEITELNADASKAIDVAPFAGAWIEIEIAAQMGVTPETSLPSRERGLKSRWGCRTPESKHSRSLRGSVD